MSRAGEGPGGVRHDMATMQPCGSGHGRDRRIAQLPLVSRSRSRLKPLPQGTGSPARSDARPYSRSRLLRALAFACCLTAGLPALAAPPSPPPSRYTLKRATVEPAPQQSGRYTLRARATPAPSAGELRESTSYALIGRFAKAGVGCSDRIFLNGFENP